MSTLLVQSCSKSKDQARSPGPAFDIYSGYYYKILKKAIDEGAFDERLDVCILSAEHGVLAPDDEIEVYDRKMDADRASQLREEVTADLRTQVERGDHDRIVINAGETYRAAIDTDPLPVPVHEVPGDGLGEKGHYLKRFIRGEAAVVMEEP